MTEPTPEHVTPAPMALRPIGGLGRWCVGVLWLLVLTHLVWIGFAITLYRFISWLEGDGAEADDGALVAYADQVDAFGMMAGVLLIGVTLVALVINGIWIYRAADNAGRIHPTDARITPGWAVGWFFVPFANIWFPFKSLRETWNTSTMGPGHLIDPSPLFMRLHWAGWIISTATTQVASRMYESDDTSTLQSAVAVDITSSVVTIATAVLFAKYITGVTNAQTTYSNNMTIPKEEA